MRVRVIIFVVCSIKGIKPVLESFIRAATLCKDCDVEKMDGRIKWQKEGWKKGKKQEG